MAVTVFSIGTNAHFGVGTAEQTVPGGTFTNVDGILNFNFTITNDEIDFSSNDAAYDIKRYGRQRASGSVEFIYDPASAGQGTLLDNARTPTITALRFRPQGAGALPEYAFDALLSSSNPTMENNGAVRCTINFVSAGQIAYDANQA